MKYIANFLSVVFHPVLMPLIGILIIFNSGVYQSNIPFEVKKFAYITVVLFSMVLPLALISMLSYWRIIQNVELKERRERFLPVMFTFVSVFILHIIMGKTIPIKLLHTYTLSMLVVLLLYLLTNIKIKTSLHLLALGGILGLLAIISKVFGADLFLWVLIAVLITGLAGTSRIYLEAHTLLELGLGFIIGFTGVFFTGYFLL